MWIFSLLILVFFLAAGCIWYAYHEPRWMFYVLKPLTMVLICLAAILGGNDLSVYKMMIIAGLVFSLAGDIFLMLPSDRFLSGLIAFLFAHLCYITAFISEINAVNWWLPIPFIIIGLVFVYFIFPRLGTQKIPVIIYVVIILVMGWLASEQWYQVPQIGTLMIFIGAILFTVSDLLLAINRFQGSFKSYKALNLTTYFTAQLLIASSVGMLVL